MGVDSLQVYYTSSADVADLIDHLSRDLHASRGRIDILPTSPPAQCPSLPHSFSKSTPDTLSPESQFEDAPSPRRMPPIPIFAPKPSATVPAAGFSPKRQLHIRQGLSSSPGGVSFASSGSGQGGRSVEDRLQALLDRLQEGGPGVSQRE